MRLTPHPYRPLHYPARVDQTEQNEVIAQTLHTAHCTTSINLKVKRRDGIRTIKQYYFRFFRCYLPVFDRFQV